MIIQNHSCILPLISFIMEPNNNESRWSTFVWSVLAISLSLNVLLFIKRTEIFPSKRILLHEKLTLDSLTNQYRDELYKYRGISERIDNIIADGAEQIHKKEIQIQSLYQRNKNLKESNDTLLFQLDSLKNSYLTTIDSLIVERKEKNLINDKFKNMEETIADLNKKVGLGSLLIGNNLEVQPLKYKSNGKTQVTAISAKTVDLKVCVTVLENKISKRGIRNIYFVLTSPEAKVITHKGASQYFVHPEYNTGASFSKRETINYTGKSAELCSVITPQGSLVPGLYIVEVFCDENKLATSTFTLK